jgi:hypothetical protein
VPVTFIGGDGTPYASKAFTIQELDQLTGLTTDANGVATFDVPVTLPTATLVFTDSGESCACSIGGMDPIDTLSGIFKRLQNLGYIGANAPFDSVNPTNNLSILRAGIQSLKAGQSSCADASPPEQSRRRVGPCERSRTELRSAQ